MVSEWQVAMPITSSGGSDLAAEGDDGGAATPATPAGGGSTAAKAWPTLEGSADRSSVKLQKKNHQSRKRKRLRSRTSDWWKTAAPIDDWNDAPQVQTVLGQRSSLVEADAVERT